MDETEGVCAKTYGGVQGPPYGPNDVVPGADSHCLEVFKFASASDMSVINIFLTKSHLTSF